jgi:hypothetical protein
MAYIPPEAQAEIVKLENQLEEVQKRERGFEADLARQSKQLEQARWWGYVATGLALILLLLIAIHKFVRPIGMFSRGSEAVVQTDLTPLVEQLQLALDESQSRADSLEAALAEAPSASAKPARSSSPRRSKSTASAAEKPITVDGVIFKVIRGQQSDYGLQLDFDSPVPLTDALRTQLSSASLGAFEDFNNARRLKLSQSRQQGVACFIVAERQGAELVPLKQVVNQPF